MNIEFTEIGWEDYQYWATNNPRQLKRINNLIKTIIRTPFEGRGKPEALRGNLTGFWSRRIDREHRIVYKISGTGSNQKCTIIQCRYHY